METLYRDLAEDIKIIEQYNQSMDSASWGYEEGILITGSQAKVILEHTAQLQADKAELLSALEKCWEVVPLDTYEGRRWFDEIDSLIKKHKQ